SKHSLVNTRITTGTAPVNQNIHWQTLALLLEQLQKSKHSLAKGQGIFTDKFKTLVNTHFYRSSKSKHRLINTHFYNSSKSKYSLANTRIATGTAPVNQNIHWQTLTFTAPVNQNIHW
ncbi:hypothetical protein, partial [Tenacibaculum finnmarkense]